jgi:integrase
MDVSRAVRPSGHLQVKGRRGARRYYALWRDAEGRHQRMLGPAHVKDSGRRTARGAIVWRAADGPKPAPEWLTPDDAAVVLRTLLVDAPSKPAQRSGSPPFADVCAEWLRHGERERQLKRSTLIDYHATVASRLLPAFGPRPVDAITAQDLETWRQELLELGELSHRTINKLLMVMGAVLERARQRGLITDNPARHVPKLKERPYDDLEFYEPEEVRELARAAASETDATIFLLLAFSGLRRGEALALTWRDVDFDREVIRVRANWSHGQLVTTKGDRVRSVPLVPQLADPLRVLREREPARSLDDPVFCNEVGERLDGSALRRRFLTARDRAGLRPLRLHDLRHTFASLAIDIASPVEVQAWAGHRDARTTARYTHYKSRRDEAQRLARAFGSLPEAGPGTKRATPTPRPARPLPPEIAPRDVGEEPSEQLSMFTQPPKA